MSKSNNHKLFFLMILTFYKVDKLVLAGGVASNSMLRTALSDLEPIFAQPQFSTDNAMGVAVIAHRMQEE